MINLFTEPFVIAHKTGISRETQIRCFSAFTAKSSPSIPAVFLLRPYLIVRHRP
jgi:hypothetical protein